ncbi:MAG: UDP-N-acetylglucosamine--N-acetylmuramyl-(pentapeptide) pyrophosphoryl-undecaprenol N-acetylglucosamine transferase, partial [bacterium]|nr:UDP-N-acetylglucosamine--N-acetylmuramyl-(pentapeptide) pyrophosphoryl-undecaprenol N-acetylglucosamine transferase [bacterium]
GEPTVSVEKRTISRMGIPFYNLRTGRLYRSGLMDLVKIPWGLLHAFYLLLKIRPRLVVSFGGYLAAPVVLMAFVLRIPSVTHEQTAVSGWANRLIARFSKKVFVSWKESLKNFPKNKTVLTGNPLRAAIFNSRTPRFRFKNDQPTVYVTGGKQGAHVINEAVRLALSQFLERFNLIHQTGSSQAYQDYQKLILLKNQLPAKVKKNYLVQEYFGEEEIGAVLNSADVVVGRSGANTVYELAALGKPAVLIPIPWASHNEQFRNAQILAEAGAAVILLQDSLSSASLLEALESVLGNYKKFRRAAEAAKKIVRRDAAERIAEEISAMLDLD